MDIKISEEIEICAEQLMEKEEKYNKESKEKLKNKKLKKLLQKKKELNTETNLQNQRWTNIILANEFKRRIPMNRQIR